MSRNVVFGSGEGDTWVPAHQVSSRDAVLLAPRGEMDEATARVANKASKVSQMYKFVLYVKAGCKHCMAAKHLLSDHPALKAKTYFADVDDPTEHPLPRVLTSVPALADKAARRMYFDARCFEFIQNYRNDEPLAQFGRRQKRQNRHALNRELMAGTPVSSMFTMTPELVAEQQALSVAAASIRREDKIDSAIARFDAARSRTDALTKELQNSGRR